MFDAVRAPLARLFGKPAGKPAARPRWVEVGQLRERLGGSAAPLIVDVRGLDEFAGPLGHIEGARNIPLSELAAHRDEIAAAQRPVVLVCLTDRRSSAGAAQLAECGIGDVTVLRGGMKAWREADR